MVGNRGKARQASVARGFQIYHHHVLHKELQASMTTYRGLVSKRIKKNQTGETQQDS